MNCPKCKYTNLHGANYCEKCGTDLKAAAKMAAQPTPVAGYGFTSGASYTSYGANIRPTRAPKPTPAPMPDALGSAAHPSPPPTPRTAPSRPAPPPPRAVAPANPQAARPSSPPRPSRPKRGPFLTPPKTSAEVSGSATPSPPARTEPKPFGELLAIDGTRFPLRYDDNLIGRASPSEGIVPAVDLGAVDRSGSTSRRHAKIGKDDQAVFLEDLGSSNGTRLNGQPLRVGLQAPLNDGDEIVFGDNVFTYRATNSA